MAATVTGTFTLLDRASSTLRKIEAQAKKTDRALEGVGDRVDDIGTRSQMAQHEELGRKLRQTGGNADFLTQRLDRTKSSSNRLASATGALGGTMGGATVAGRSFGSVMTVLGTVFAALLPIIVDVGGALGALIGSLGRALKGASALAVGGIGVLGVAIGGLAGTMLPAITNLGKLSQAFNAVNEAQQKYGRGSKEARDAMKEMAQARQGMENFDAKRGMAVVRGFDTMKSDWSKMTAKGQSSALQMILDAMNTTRSLMPFLARNANEIAAATGRAMRVFWERLDGPQFRRFVNTMTNVYEDTIMPIVTAFTNIGEALGNIAVAAAPELVKLADALERTTEGWLKSTKSIAGMRGTISAASRETGDWYRLLKSAWDWMVALFGPGANEGQGLVQAMTDKLNEQTAWFESNPEKMKDFYKTAGEGARRLAETLGDIGPTLMDISDAMRPITQAFQELIQLLSKIKVGDLSALTLGIFGMGVGRLGSMARDFGGGKFLATGGLTALMGAGTMRGWWSGEGARGGGGVYRGLGPLELLSGARSGMLRRQQEMLRQQQGMASPGVGMGSPGGGYAGLGGIPAGVIPVFVVNPGGLGGGGMASPGKGGGGPGALPFFLGGGASSVAMKPWWAKVPGLRTAGTAMTTVAARGNMAAQNAAMAPGMAGRAAGLGMGLGRVGMGVARFAGRAFWPLAALMGIGDFLGTEGNFGQKLQGAASGATFGVIPKPMTDEARTQRGIETAGEFMKEQMEANGKGMRGMSKTVEEITKRIDVAQQLLRGDPYGPDGVIGRTELAVSAATDNGNATELRAYIDQLTKDKRVAVGSRDAQSLQRASGAQSDLSRAFDLAFSKRGDKAYKTFVDNALYELSRLEGSGARALSQANLTWLAEQKKDNPKLKKVYNEFAQGVEDRFKEMGRRVQVINGQIFTSTQAEYERLSGGLGTNLERERQRGEKLTPAQKRLAASLSQWTDQSGNNLGVGTARRVVEDVEGARNPEVAAVRRLNRIMRRRTRRQTASAIEGTGYEGMAGNPIIQAMSGTGATQQFSPREANLKPVKIPKVDGQQFRKSLDAISTKMDNTNDKIKEATGKKWTKVRGKMVDEMKKAVPELQSHMAKIRSMTLGQLQEFGYTASEAKEIFKFSGGNPNQTPEEGATGMRLPGFAGGGRIKGTGRQDTVPITLGMAAPGELIVNRHTERDINRDLRASGKPSLGERVAGETRKHSEAEPFADRIGGFSKGGRFSTSGRIGGTLIGGIGGGYPMVTGDTDFSPALGNALSNMAKQTGQAIYVQSGGRTYAEQAYLYATKGPGIAAPPGSSKHETGMAADITPGREVFGAAAGQHGLAFTVPHESWHIELVGAGGGGAAIAIPMGAPAPQVKIDAPRSKLKGVPGGFSQGASNILAKGKQRKVNAELRRRGGVGGGVGPPGGGTVVGASVYGGGSDPTSGIEGYRGDSLPGTSSYAELGYDGSGNPESANLLGGLPYMTPLRITYGDKSVVAQKRDIGTGGGAVQGKPRAIDLWHETAGALGFPFGVDLVKVEQMARGGRVPFGGWFGDGGQFTADRPTLIGVGERGKEHVQITPSGKGKAMSGVKIENITINNHRKGDIRKQVKEEIGQAFRQLEREMDNEEGGIV